MRITEDLMNQGKSCRGGWSNKQLRALGLPENYISKKDGGLVKGWRQYLLSQNASDMQVSEFLALKNKHLKNANEIIEDSCIMSIFKESQKTSDNPY